MSQHDLSIANQGFPAFRSDLNDALQALGSLNSGATAPSTTYANMLWYDTANNIIKIRNEDNDAWISIATLDQSTDVVSSITATTVNGTTVAAGTLTSSGNTTLGDASGDSVTINASTVSTPNGLNFDSNTLVIDATNDRVGMGTSSPSNKLHVKAGNGNQATFDNAGERFTQINLQNNGTNKGAIWLDNTDNFFEVYGYSGIGIKFSTNGTERLTIPSNAAGIKFPATQSASSDANTLDDYEEGTFTPSPEGTSVSGTATYVNRVGSYVKIGRHVTCWIHLNWNSGTGSGSLLVTGLPFSTANNNNYSVPSLYFDAISITSGNQFQAYIGPNGTRIDFIQYRSSDGSTGTIGYDSQGVILATFSYLAAS